MRLEEAVQFLNLTRVSQCSVLCHEAVKIVKRVLLDIVEQCKQLLGVVLNWRTCEQKYPATGVLLKQRESLSLLVLQSVSFINDHILERDIFEYIRQIRIEHFV